jgi:hypothetical protein
MKELFEKWAVLKDRRYEASLSPALNRAQITEEIQTLEALLANGCRNIPGEEEDVPSILGKLLAQLRDLEG